MNSGVSWRFSLWTSGHLSKVMSNRDARNVIMGLRSFWTSGHHFPKSFLYVACARVARVAHVRNKKDLERCLMSRGGRLICRRMYALG